MIYPLNRLNKGKWHSKGRRKTSVPSKNKIVSSINQKEQELSRVQQIGYTLSNNKAVDPSEEKGEMKWK